MLFAFGYYVRWSRRAEVNMYTTDLMHERVRELRAAGRATRDAGLRPHRVRALKARMHSGR